MTTLYAAPETLWNRVLARVEHTDADCWLWTGALNSKGYGLIGSGRKSTTVLTHRLAVLVRDGYIPDGMTIDHLCEVKRCVNPAHLEVVTRSENTKRYYENRRPKLPTDWAPGADRAFWLDDLLAALSNPSP